MESWRFNLYFFTCVLCLSSAFQIYETTAVNNVFPAVQNWLHTRYSGRSKEYAYSMWSTTVGSTIMGRLVGTLIGGYLADLIGRRQAFLYTSLLLTISGILSLFSKYGTELWMLAVNRQLFGISYGSGTIVASLYIVECSPPSMRGQMILIQQIFRSLGEVAGYVLGIHELMGTEALWPYLLAVSSIPGPISLILLYSLFPETPNFLMIVKNDSAEGRKSILFYQGEENLDSQLAAYISTSMGFFRLVVSFGFAPFTDRFRRKSLAIYSVLINTIGPIGAMIAAYEGSAFWTGIFMIQYIASGAIAFSVTRSLSLELFDQSDRSLANTLGHTFRHLVTGISGMTYISLQQGVGVTWSLFPLVMNGLLLVVVIICMVPDESAHETNSQSAEPPSTKDPQRRVRFRNSLESANQPLLSDPSSSDQSEDTSDSENGNLTGKV